MAARPPKPLDGLTPRETEVLILILAGLTTKRIASHLGISFKTAATHRTHIMDKLNVHNVANLIRHPISHNLATTTEGGWQNASTFRSVQALSVQAPSVLQSTASPNLRIQLKPKIV